MARLALAWTLWLSLLSLVSGCGVNYYSDGGVCTACSSASLCTTNEWETQVCSAGFRITQKPKCCGSAAINDERALECGACGLVSNGHIPPDGRGTYGCAEGFAISGVLCTGDTEEDTQTCVQCPPVQTNINCGDGHYITKRPCDGTPPYDDSFECAMCDTSPCPGTLERRHILRDGTVVNSATCTGFSDYDTGVCVECNATLLINNGTCSTTQRKVLEDLCGINAGAACVGCQNTNNVTGEYQCSRGFYKTGSVCDGSVSGDTQTCEECGHRSNVTTYQCPRGYYRTGSECDGTTNENTQTCEVCDNYNMNPGNYKCPFGRFATGRACDGTTDHDTQICLGASEIRLPNGAPLPLGVSFGCERIFSVIEHINVRTKEDLDQQIVFPVASRGQEFEFTFTPRQIRQALLALNCYGDHENVDTSQVSLTPGLL